MLENPPSENYVKNDYKKPSNMPKKKRTADPTLQKTPSLIPPHAWINFTNPNPNSQSPIPSS